MNNELKELRDNYLISVGAGIDNSYTFIDASKIEIQEEEFNETINIGNLSVIKNNKYRNYILLKNVLENAMNVHVNGIANLISNGKVVDNLQDIYNLTNMYFIDVIKYITSSIKIDVNIFNLLVTLNNRTIEEFTGSFNVLLQKYNMKIESAKEQRINMQNSIDKDIIANSSPNYAYSRTYTRDSYTGIGEVSYTTTYVGKPKGLENLGNNPYVGIIEEMSKDDANKELVSETIKLLNNVVTKYIKTILEVLTDRLPNLYNNEIEKYTYLDYWKEIILHFNLDDYDKLIDVFNYYMLDLNSYIRPILEESLYIHYINTYECNYDGNDLKLYYRFNNDNKYIPTKGLSSKIKNALYDKYAKDLKRKNDKTYFQEKVNNCSYLLDEDKQSILNRYSENIKNKKTMRKEDINDYCGGIFAFLVIVGLVLLYYGVFKDNSLILYIYIGLHVINLIVIIIFGDIIQLIKDKINGV